MAPPDDYGWAYIDPQRASASADGPSGAVQFRYGSEDLVPGQFSGSEDLVFYANNVGHKADSGTGGGADGSGSALYLYGNLYITGAVHAETYTIRQVNATEIDVSGSTNWGDTDAASALHDSHRMTGSLEVSAHTTMGRKSAAMTHQRTGSFEVSGWTHLASNLDVSGTVGPLTGSGEIHAAKLVGNDLAISGSTILGTTKVAGSGVNSSTHQITGSVWIAGDNMQLYGTHPKLTIHADAASGDPQIIFKSGDGSQMGNIRVDVTSNTLNHIAISAVTGEDDLVVDLNGRVGIGTTSPSQQLDVAGNVNLGSNSYTTISDNEYDVSSGNLTLDVAGNMFVDAGGGNVVFKDDGTNQIAMDMAGTGGEIVIQLKVDSDDLVFKQYDGQEVIRIADDRKLYFYDQGGEHISSDGTDLTIVAGADINLSAATDINIPADVGLTFGNDAEKIEGDGTDLTIAGNNINLTAVQDVVIPADVGITFGTGEKIEGNNTDLTVTSGADINLTATDDINLPANVGLTFGDDGEKIEGNGSRLLISSGANLVLDSEGSIRLDSDTGDVEFLDGGTVQLALDMDSTAGDIILQLKVDADDLVFKQYDGNEVIRISDDRKLYFYDDGGEHISSDGTDLTIAAGADINLTATTDINIPSGVGLTFGDDGEKIEGNGSRLLISSGANMVLDSEGSIKLDSDTGDVEFLDGGTSQLTLDMDSNAGEIALQLKVDSDDLVFKQYDGNEVIRIADDRKLYFYDQGGEHISSDGSSLTIAGGTSIILNSSTTAGIQSSDTHQVTGSFEVSGPAHFTSEVHAEATLNVDGLSTLGTSGSQAVVLAGTLSSSAGAQIHAEAIYTNDIFVSGSVTGLTVSYNDNDALNIGSSNDLAITHDGTNTKFVNTTGHLWFDNQDADDNIRFDLGTDDTNTKFQIRNNSGTNLLHVLGDGLVSGSGNLAVQGSASFGQPVTISGDLVFHAAATAGVIDIKVNDGSGADTAIQIAKAGKVTKIGDDTPSDGQLLTWDGTANKVKWDDGVVGISGSSVHYSGTELRTSGDLNVSGSTILGTSLTSNIQVSGTFEVAGPSHFTGEVHAEDILNVDGVLTATGGTVLGNASGDTHQVTGSLAVSDTLWVTGNAYAVADLKVGDDLLLASDSAAIQFGDSGEVHLIHNADKGLLLKHTNTNDDKPVSLVLQTGETSISNSEEIGSLKFQAPDEANGGDGALVCASIAAVATEAFNATRNGTKIVFATAESSLPVERMALLADGTLTGYDAGSATWTIDASGSIGCLDIAVADEIVHAADTDTKIAFSGNSLAFHAGTDNQPQMTITNGGVVFNEDSADRDFRIETNADTHAFFVDGNDPAALIKLAGGYGDTGVTIAKTGSIAADGFIHSDERVQSNTYFKSNEIRDLGNNVILSFDGSGAIDENITMTANQPVFNMIANNAKPIIKMYGPGQSISAGEDLAEIQFYGTEDDGTGNSAQVAGILVESCESSWVYNSAIGSKMVFKVGLKGTTTLASAMTITGDEDQNSTLARVGINVDIGGAVSNVGALNVKAESAYDYAAFFHNDANASTAYGVLIAAGQDTMDTANTMLRFNDGNQSFLGSITGNGLTLTYGTFTGAHETILENEETLLPYGTILTIKSVTSNQKQPEYICAQTTVAKDKAVLGAYNCNMIADPEEERRSLHQVNALGDGHILVCSEGGNIERGDYICSSNTAGYGMKQDDDLLHNYTVAKASEPVDWSAEAETTKLIACTYHCG